MQETPRGNREWGGDRRIGDNDPEPVTPLESKAYAFPAPLPLFQLSPNRPNFSRGAHGKIGLERQCILAAYHCFIWSLIYEIHVNQTWGPVETRLHNTSFFPEYQ